MRTERGLPLARVLAATGLALVIAVLAGALLAGVGDPNRDDDIVHLDPDAQQGNAAPTLGGGGDDAVGQDAPTDAFETFAGGNASIADYAGTPLVVNFFASSCVPCVEEMPAFERVHQDLGGRVAFLGINEQESVTKGQGLIDETGITYDTGRDPSGSLLAQFGGVAMPTTALVDADGTIVRILTGNTSAPDLRAAIREDLLS